MENPQKNLYYKGYIAGYWDGLKDGACGKITYAEDRDILSLPIQAMGLSTRAYHCLLQAGCACIADVATLSDQAIIRARHMGIKTRSEIAHWLDDHEICCNAWGHYL